MPQINKIEVLKKLPIFDTIIDDHESMNEYLKSSIDEEQLKNPRGYNSNVKAWESGYLTHLRSNKFNPIINLALNFCKVSLAHYYFSNPNIFNADYKCNNFWVAKYVENDYAIKHDHFPSEFSCVYYVDVKENCSPIIFEDEYIVTPKNGMMLLFPGVIKHHVPPTKYQRTIAALNIDKIDPN